jgi:hypothetical protein
MKFSLCPLDGLFRKDCKGTEMIRICCQQAIYITDDRINKKFRLTRDESAAQARNSGVKEIFRKINFFPLVGTKG